MTAVVLRGDAAHIPLPDNSVDLIATSPPYWALRSYTDGGTHYDGQIGSEATPGEWVAALIECTREWMRVLKPSGSIFVNCGDKYAQPGKGERNMQGVGGGIVHKVGAVQANRSARDVSYDGLPGKSLLGLPWRYALACTDQLGLILRAEIIWSKPNGLPESVTDRVRRSHEQIFHMVKQPRYYSAVDEIREPQQSLGERHNGRSGYVGAPDGIARSFSGRALSPLGKLPGSVWEIASQPLTVPPSLGVDHFAAFPMELPRRIILGWSPPGVCTACGEGRRPVAAADYHVTTADINPESKRLQAAQGNNFAIRRFDRALRTTTITHYTCSCDPDAYLGLPLPPTRPAVVLDPFGGTGTTALVASAHGRVGISIDRSADYCRLARWRTTDPGQRAAALQVPKPPPQVDGQLDLWAAAD